MLSLIWDSVMESPARYLSIFFAYNLMLNKGAIGVFDSIAWGGAEKGAPKAVEVIEEFLWAATKHCYD